MRNSTALSVIVFALSIGVTMLVMPHAERNSNSASGQEPASEEAVSTAPITVSGRAVNQDDEPVVGARITLVSTNGIDKRLAETTTNADGRYVFREIPLPVKPAPVKSVNGEKKDDSRRAGTIQVFGEAEGLAIAWHGMRHYITQPRPDNAPRGNGDHTFYKDDPIEMNLILRKPMELTGRVTDDDGKPVENLQIEVANVDYLDTEGLEPHPNFREFWVMALAPARYREARTGADGRFTIKGLPEESVVVVQVHHPNFANQMLRAAITSSNVTEWNKEPVLTSPLTIRARATRRLIVTVRNDDDRRLAKGVVVYASSTGDEPDTGDYGLTDEKGRVELKVPPGTYRLTADPPRDSNYVRSRGKVTVQDKPAEQACELDVNLGCILIFEAVDAATGAGVPGATFWYESEDGRGTRQLGNSTFYIVNQETNDKGEFRAVVYPGTREYTIHPPNDYRCDAEQQTAECQAGKTIRVRFELKRK